MIRSGNLPDIVGGSKLQHLFNEYGPQGAFLPLNDLIKEHAPNIKAFFDARPEIWDAVVANDGNLDPIGYFPDDDYGRGYFIRQDWLDALDLKIPQNVDELYDVLVAFKTRDPNGNGIADELPYFARHGSEVYRLVTLWDGRSSGSDCRMDFYVENGEIVHGYAQEAFRTGIRNLAKWYQEGLINPAAVLGVSA